MLTDARDVTVHDNHSTDVDYCTPDKQELSEDSDFYSDIWAAVGRNLLSDRHICEHGTVNNRIRSARRRMIGDITCEITVKKRATIRKLPKVQEESFRFRIKTVSKAQSALCIANSTQSIMP